MSPLTARAAWSQDGDHFTPYGDAPRDAYPTQGRPDMLHALNLLDVARICHEANRAFCVHLGDDSQPAWEDAPDWQRDSCIDGVAFHLRNPGADDAASHQNWFADKRAAGWVYGPRKDATAKTHPMLVPFAQLDRDAQFKDRLFATIVRATIG